MTKIETTFVPIVLQLDRAYNSIDDSDIAGFYDLLHLGEMISKIITLSLVAAIKSDSLRTRYSLHYELVRADSIGVWADVLSRTLVGPAQQLLDRQYRDNELKELTIKVSSGWQYEALQNLNTALNIFRRAGSLPSKVQFRNWFAMFVQLRNATRGHGAPSGEQCAAAIVPLHESLKYIIENYCLFGREWAYLHESYSKKYRVTALNGSSIYFDHLRKSKEYSTRYKDGLYVYYSDITTVDLIYSSVDAIDFHFANGSFGSKYFEAISYSSNSTIECESENYKIPVMELQQSTTDGSQTLSIEGNVFTNKPVTPPDLIDRTDLEARLNYVLSEVNRYPIVTLHGRGGIGKTSLALKALAEIVTTSRYDIVLWFSSRDIDLLPEGIRHVQPAILNVEDIATSFIKMTGSIGLVNETPVELLARHMKSSELGRILFVFDNFETVDNPAELFAWINSHIENPNKALITSRISSTFVADIPIEVAGMSEEECRNLIEASTKTLSIPLEEDVIRNILDQSDGHPYIVKILLGYFALNPERRNVEQVLASKDELLNALFSRTYNSLTVAARRVFLTLCSWRMIIPQLALEAVLLRPENEYMDVEEAIEELRKSSLIEIVYSDDRYPYISVPLSAFIFGKRELQVSYMQTSVLADRALLQEFGTNSAGAQYYDIEQRVLQKIKMVARHASGDVHELNKRLPTLEYIARRYNKAWKYLADMMYDVGENVRAHQYITEYLKTPIDPDESYIVWNKVAKWSAESHDVLNEVNAMNHICKSIRASSKEIFNIARKIDLYIREKKMSMGDSSYEIHMETIVRDIITVCDKHIYRTGTADDYLVLGELSLVLGDHSRAKNYIEKGLERFPTSGRLKKALYATGAYSA